MIKSFLRVLAASAALAAPALAQDLRELLKHVKDSSVLVLFQSSKVLERPWCLLELYTAVMEGVPIVALNCAGKGYDFGKSADLLLHLETELAKLNPSAVQVLKSHGVDPLHAAHVLSSAIPNIISVHLNTSANRIAIKATMVDLVKGMQAAKPFPVETSLEDWLASRGEKAASIIDISGTVKGQMMAKAERADELAKEIVDGRLREGDAVTVGWDGEHLEVSHTATPE